MASAMSAVGSNIFKKKNTGMQQNNVNFTTDIQKPYMDTTTGKPQYDVEQVANEQTGFWKNGEAPTALSLIGGIGANVFRNMQGEDYNEYRNTELQNSNREAATGLSQGKASANMSADALIGSANRAGRDAMSMGQGKMFNTGGEGNMAAIGSKQADEVYARGANEGSAMRTQGITQATGQYTGTMSGNSQIVENRLEGDNPFAAAASGLAQVPGALAEARYRSLERLQNKDFNHDARAITDTGVQPLEAGISTDQTPMKDPNNIENLGTDEKNPMIPKPANALKQTGKYAMNFLNLGGTKDRIGQSGMAQMNLMKKYR